MATAMAIPQMTQDQQAIFNAWYAATRRDEILGVLLALLLGSFGAHHFYLRRTTLGVIYLIFFWTGIPAILGFIEAFFMPERVREFNAGLAGVLTHAVLAGAAPPYVVQATVTCSQCGYVQPAEARYCARCGRALA